MKLVQLDAFGQAGQHAGTVTHAGWNSIPSIKAGVWLYDTSFTFWNACPGAGELYLDRIEATFDVAIPHDAILPRSNWRIDPARPNVLIIGTGHEYIPPRGSIRVRWAYPTRCPATAMYGPAKLTFALSQRRNIFSALKASLVQPRETGMLAPFNPTDKDPGAPGGFLVGSLGGWEQDAPGFLLRADMTMERMPVGRLDQATGQPIRTQAWGTYIENGVLHYNGYTTDRGWSESTQLDDFTQHPANIYDQHRVPYVTWPGTCSYRDLVLGVQRVPSYLPYDKQHLSRALIPLKAAAQCGDPSARFDLDMVAADCQAARTDASSLPNGSRDLGWTIDAFAHSRLTFGLARTLASRDAAAQTASGALAQFGPDHNLNPSPYVKQGEIVDPMPLNMLADPILERSISCHAVALDSHLATVKRALAGMPHPVPHFVGVADEHGPFPTYQHPCGNPTWEIWMGIGAGAALDPHGTWWHAYALGNSTPGGKRGHTLVELRDILRAETVGMDQTAVLRAVIEELLA